MLSTLRSPRFWVFALLFLALLTISVGGSSSFLGCIQAHKPQATEQKDNDGIAHIVVTASLYRECVGDFIHGNVEAIIATFTVLLALSTIALWDATRRLFEAGERQFMATHRPEILVRTIQATGGGKKQIIGARLTIVNKGETDAIVDKIEGIIFPGASYVLPEITGNKLPYAARKLAPGGIWEEIDILSSERDTDFLNDKVRLWCVGRIDYTDGGGRKRQTGFCRVYDSTIKKWNRQDDPDYEYAY
jgi:hypothetical protein